MQDDDSTVPSSAAELVYQLFILGLAWLREAKPEVPVRRGASVMAAISLAGPGFAKTRSTAEMGWDLRDLVLEHAQIHEGEKPPNKKELAKLVTTSDKSTIIIAKPPIEVASSDFSPQALFGPKGYSFAITDSGIAFAMRLVGQFEPHFTSAKFLAGWEAYCKQVRHVKGTQGKVASAPQDPDVESEAWRGNIPYAPRVKPEWE